MELISNRFTRFEEASMNLLWLWSPARSVGAAVVHRGIGAINGTKFLTLILFMFLVKIRALLLEQCISFKITVGF